MKRKQLLRIVVMAEHEHDIDSPEIDAVNEAVLSLVDTMTENGVPGVIATMDYDHKDEDD